MHGNGGREGEHWKNASFIYVHLRVQSCVCVPVCFEQSDSQTIFDAIDIDGSGHITYDEFVDFLGVKE